jgi:hypothetical protein
MTIGFRLCISLIFALLAACSPEHAVQEHFKDHGLSFPVDSSELSLWNIEYAGIKDDELSAPGAREYVEEGLSFAKAHVKRKKPYRFMPGAVGIVLSKPVLFRGESGDVGLMVKVQAFGTGKPDGTMKDTVRWIGPDRKLWSMENFAYFGRNELYQWEYKGMVY